MFIEHLGESACHPGKVEGVVCAFSGDEELLLALVGDELGAQPLGVCVDEKRQLRDDREPDVVGAEHERVVVVVRVEHGVHKSITAGKYVIGSR